MHSVNLLAFIGFSTKFESKKLKSKNKIKYLKTLNKV